LALLLPRIATEKRARGAFLRLKMLVRALKVLDYFRNEITRTDIDTAALDQPGDEGWAYGRRKAKWQR
jgi:hypothetical protein